MTFASELGYIGEGYSTSVDVIDEKYEVTDAVFSRISQHLLCELQIYNEERYSAGYRRRRVLPSTATGGAIPRGEYKATSRPIRDYVH